MGPFGEDIEPDDVRKKPPLSEVEYRLSLDAELCSPIEDFMAGNPAKCSFNGDRQEWAFEVIGSVGWPRKRLVVFVITWKLGLLQTSLEEVDEWR